MPPASMENAPMSITPQQQQLQQQQLQQTQQQQQGRQNYEASLTMTKKAPSVPAPGDDTVELRKQTRTLNYAWRSGVAGGLAGCAVWRFYLFFPLFSSLTSGLSAGRSFTNSARLFSVC